MPQALIFTLIITITFTSFETHSIEVSMCFTITTPIQFSSTSDMNSTSVAAAPAPRNVSKLQDCAITSIIILVVFALSAGFVCFIVLVIFNGSCLLDVDIPQVQIESATISSLNSSHGADEFSDANWTIGFLFKNQKKLTLFYEDLSVRVSKLDDQEYRWTEKAIPAFRQGPRGQTLVPVSLKASWHFGKRMEGVVNFDVTLSFSIHCKSWYTINWLSINGEDVVYGCKDLKVAFSANSTEGEMFENDALSCVLQKFIW